MTPQAGGPESKRKAQPLIGDPHREPASADTPRPGTPAPGPSFPSCELGFVPRTVAIAEATFPRGVLHTRLPRGSWDVESGKGHSVPRGGYLGPHSFPGKLPPSDLAATTYARGFDEQLVPNCLSERCYQSVLPPAYLTHPASQGWDPAF